MSQKQGPTEERIRAAIEARIDRLIALEELSWELRSSIDDLCGRCPRRGQSASRSSPPILAAANP